MKNDSRYDGTAHQVKVITPVGDAEWASLKVPKQWMNEDKMNFLCTIILAKDDAQPIIDTCNGVIEKVREMLETGAKLSPHDPWKELDDGRIALKFKRPAFAANDKYPASRPITTYNTDGSRVIWEDTDWAVGNGSRIKVGGYVRPYYVPMHGLGISLRLEAVSIVELVEYAVGGSEAFADDFGGGVDAKNALDATVNAGDF